MGRHDGGGGVDFNDAAVASMPQANGVKIQVLTAQRCHGVDGFGHAPRPRSDGGKRPVGEQRCNGKTDAGAHHHAVRRSAGFCEEGVVKNNALWKRVMALGRTVQRQDAHAVLCHGVERSVMFSKCSHVVMHHRQRLRWRIVDEGDGCESCIITDECGFEPWIHGVAVVVMDEVLFERGEGFSHFERRECAGDIG